MFLPAVPTTVGSSNAPWSLAPGDAHGFNTLGYRPEGRVYFQYAVAADASPAYTIEARSDLDGDAAYNTWGYLKPALNTTTGIAGPFGVCPTSGVLDWDSGLFNLLKQIGPCDAQSGSTEF